MLESVTLRGEPVSLPTLCEALVYYQRVHVAGHAGLFLKVASELGEDNFIRLLSQGVLKLDLANFDHGVLGDGPPPATCRLVEISMGRPNASFHDVLCEAARNPNRRGQRVNSKTLQLIADHVSDLGHPRLVLQGALKDLNNVDLTTNMVANVVDCLVPGFRLPPDFYARCFVFGDELSLVTNLDYERLNKTYHSIVPPSEGGVITQARLIGAATIPIALMYYLADISTDIWVDSISSRLLTNKLESYARGVSQADRSITHFEEVMFGGKSFSGVVSTGGRTVGELVDFLEDNNTIKFKEMLARSKPGSDIIREYERAFLAESPLLKGIPGKLVKLALFTGISIASSGIHGALAAAVPGTIASTIDEFAISKLRLGWKPNQWVDGTARPFLFAN